MTLPTTRAAGIALLALALAACGSPSPRLDAHFGEAAGDIAKAQILRPGAERTAPLPTGQDSASAKLAYDQYLKSFKTPDTKNNSFVIGVGR